MFWRRLQRLSAMKQRVGVGQWVETSSIFSVRFRGVSQILISQLISNN